MSTDTKTSRLTQIVIAGAAAGGLVVAAGSLAVSVHNSSQISQVNIHLNSRLSELIDLTKKSSKAEGVKQEKDRQEDEKEGK